MTLRAGQSSSVRSQRSSVCLLNTATLLIVPSQVAREGLPMVALEAALMKRPVVATRDGGLPEAVVDGHTGFLVESGDEKGLERSILRVLENSELAARLGAPVAVTCSTDSTGRSGDQLLNLYARAAGGTRRDECGYRSNLRQRAGYRVQDHGRRGDPHQPSDRRATTVCAIREP